MMHHDFVYGHRTDVLGGGTHGNVYKTSRNFAIKYFTDEECAIHEIVILKNLDHPHIISIKDYHLSYQKSYIIMDLAICTLKDIVLTQMIIRQKVYYQLFSALTYMHSNNIWHLDIKPSNILVFNSRNDPLVKLADVGSSYKIGGYKFRTAITIQWRPPEILNDIDKDKLYDERADVWSVGVMLYRNVSIIDIFNSFYENDINKAITAVSESPITKNIHPHIVDNEIQLLKDILTPIIPMRKRITASEALLYTYFDDVRDMYTNIENPKSSLENPKLSLENLENSKERTDTYLWIYDILVDVYVPEKIPYILLFYTIAIMDEYAKYNNIFNNKLESNMLKIYAMASFLISYSIYDNGTFNELNELIKRNNFKYEDIYSKQNDILMVIGFKFLPFAYKEYQNIIIGKKQISLVLFAVILKYTDISKQIEMTKAYLDKSIQDEDFINYMKDPFPHGLATRDYKLHIMQ